MKTILISLLIFLLAGCNNSEPQKPLPFKALRFERRSGEYAKNPIHIRINKDLQDYVGNRFLSYQAAISIKIQHPLENGLPDEREEELLERIEALLIEKLVNTELAVYALEAKTDKRCDFIFYTGNEVAVTQAFSEIKSAIPDYEIECSIKRDKKWITYTWFSSWE